MARDPLGERWPEVYREQPEIFERFADAEDRDHLIPERLQRAGAMGGNALLELGCGSGRWTRELCGERRPYFAIEPQVGLLELARGLGLSGVQWIRARGQALPFGTGSFERLFAGFVLANQRPTARTALLQEARRVLRAGGSLWALENDQEDDFQDLRQRAGLETPVEIQPLLEDHDFELIETVETRLEFEDEAASELVLGTILGPRVQTLLAREPQHRFRHRICILRWTPAGL